MAAETRYDLIWHRHRVMPQALRPGLILSRKAVFQNSNSHLTLRHSKGLWDRILCAVSEEAGPQLSGMCFVSLASLIYRKMKGHPQAFAMRHLEQLLLLGRHMPASSANLKPQKTILFGKVHVATQSMKASGQPALLDSVADWAYPALSGL